MSLFQEMARGNRRRAAKVALVLAGATVFGAGCNSSDHTKIGDIASNPDRFAGKDVRIGGEVTQVWELPLGITNLAAYRINDGTGQIWVVSHNGAPIKGDKVGLKGTAEPIDRENLPFMRDILGDVIEEHERKMF